MKIQLFLLLYLLTLASVGWEENKQLTFPDINLEFINEKAATAANPETISSIFAEPQFVSRVKLGVAAPIKLQSVSCRGITINTVME